MKRVKIPIILIPIILYALQGICFLYIYGYIINSMARRPPEAYWSGAAGLVFDYILLFLLLASITFFITALGLSLGRGWARKLGLTISIPAAFLLILEILAIINIALTWKSYPADPSGYYTSSLSWWTFFLSIGIINSVCAYCLTRPQVKLDLSKTR